MEECILYARVSSKEQEEEGYSLPAQASLMQEYARKQKLKIVQEFVTSESAKKQGREAFGEMVRILEKKKGPKILLVEKTDRLTRNFHDVVLIDRLIQEHGVSIHLVKEGQTLHKGSNSTEMYFFYQMVLFAKHYIDKLAEETRKGMAQKAKEGGWFCSAPYGYEMVKGKLQIDPEESRFVRAAFELYGSGAVSLKECSEQLKKRGYVFRSYQPKIPVSNLERLLKRRVYVGDVEYKDQIFPGIHEPIIEPYLWVSVQKAFKKDAKPLSYQRRQFLYRGILHCEECGGLLSGELKKNGRYTYYRCSTGAHVRHRCAQGYINESKIDAALHETLKSLQIPNELKAEGISRMGVCDELASQTYKEEAERIDRMIAKARQNLRKTVEMKISGELDDTLFREISQDYKQEIDGLQNRRDNLNQADRSYDRLASDLFELPEQFYSAWFDAEEEDRVIMLNTLVSNFFIKDGNVRVELKEPFAYLYKLAKNKNWGTRWDELRTFLQQHSVTIQAIHKALCA